MLAKNLIINLVRPVKDSTTKMSLSMANDSNEAKYEKGWPTVYGLHPFLFSINLCSLR